MSEGTKELMEGYIGVKFTSVCAGASIPKAANEYLEHFQRMSKLLKEHSMTDKNAGNASVRLPDGFLVTGSGVYMAEIQLEDLVKVTEYDLDAFRLEYIGTKQPSSEALLHGLIYTNRLDACAIIHAHDPLTAKYAPMDVSITPREHEYGTADLARICLETLKAEQIVFLKNHGYVATGSDLDEALTLLLGCHNELVEQQVHGIQYGQKQLE